MILYTAEEGLALMVAIMEAADDDDNPPPFAHCRRPILRPTMTSGMTDEEASASWDAHLEARANPR